VTVVGPAPPAGAPAPPPDVAALPFPFFVTTAARTFTFSAADGDEQAAWVAAIELAAAGRGAEVAEAAAQGEALLWAGGGGGGALLLPVALGQELVDATPGVPLLARLVPR